MKNAYYSTRFGFLKDLAFGGEETIFTRHKHKTFMLVFAWLSATGQSRPSANPQAAASTWSNGGWAEGHTGYGHTAIVHCPVCWYKIHRMLWKETVGASEISDSKYSIRC